MVIPLPLLDCPDEREPFAMAHARLPYPANLSFGIGLGLTHLGASKAGGGPAGSGFLLETSGYLLLETGSFLLLEA